MVVYYKTQIVIYVAHSSHMEGKNSQQPAAMMYKIEDGNIDFEKANEVAADGAASLDIYATATQIACADFKSTDDSDVCLGELVWDGPQDESLPTTLQSLKPPQWVRRRVFRAGPNFERVAYGVYAKKGRGRGSFDMKAGIANDARPISMISMTGNNIGNDPSAEVTDAEGVQRAYHLGMLEQNKQDTAATFQVLHRGLDLLADFRYQQKINSGRFSDEYVLELNRMLKAVLVSAAKCQPGGGGSAWAVACRDPVTIKRVVQAITDMEEAYLKTYESQSCVGKACAFVAQVSRHLVDDTSELLWRYKERLAVSAVAGYVGPQIYMLAEQSLGTSGALVSGAALCRTLGEPNLLASAAVKCFDDAMGAFVEIKRRGGKLARFVGSVSSLVGHLIYHLMARIRDADGGEDASGDAISGTELGAFKTVLDQDWSVEKVHMLLWMVIKFMSRILFRAMSTGPVKGFCSAADTAANTVANVTEMLNTGRRTVLSALPADVADMTQAVFETMFPLWSPLMDRYDESTTNASHNLRQLVSEAATETDSLPIVQSMLGLVAVAEQMVETYHKMAGSEKASIDDSLLNRAASDANSFEEWTRSTPDLATYVSKQVSTELLSQLRLDNETYMRAEKSVAIQDLLSKVEAHYAEN